MKRPRRTATEAKTLQQFWHIIFKQNKHLFFISLIYFVGVIGINVIIPLFISKTIANLVVYEADIASSLLPLIVAAAIGVAANLTGFIAIIRLNARGQSDALELAFTTLLARSVGFHTNNIGGKLVSNTLDYAASFGKLLDAVYVSIIPFLLTMIVGISVVFSHSPAIGGALFAVTLVTIVLIASESYRRSGLRAERKKAQNAMIANLSDTIVNTQAVKTFAGEDREYRSHKKLDGTLMNFRLQDWTSTAVFGSTRMAVLIALQIGFIAFLGHLLSKDPSILGIGIFAFTYTLSLTAKLFDIGNMIRSVEEALLHASSMTEIILEKQEVSDAKKAKKLIVTKGTIQLENVNFAYNDAPDNEVFRNLSLLIRPGQKVGIVGPSGGGKSTLTRLLLRFDDVTNGSIRIDNTDLRDVTQASLRNAISYVPQEPLLFHRSIRENIAYGKPTAKIKDIKKAAKLAYADEFIATLPLGYDTIVGERGVKLSGGQRQRIAIARAILKDAPILILDEATSALDSESETYIQKALSRLMKDRTTIVIAHRLSTIQSMDRIIVIDKGTIMEDGTHDALIGASKMYAKLWKHQSGGFIK